MADRLERDAPAVGLRLTVHGVWRRLGQSAHPLTILPSRRERVAGVTTRRAVLRVAAGKPGGTDPGQHQTPVSVRPRTPPKPAAESTHPLRQRSAWSGEPDQTPGSRRRSHGHRTGRRLPLIGALPDSVFRPKSRFGSVLYREQSRTIEYPRTDGPTARARGRRDTPLPECPYFHTSRHTATMTQRFHPD